MAKKAMELVVTEGVTSLDEVGTAQLQLEQAEERLAALEDERTAGLQRQGQLAAKDAAEFYQLQRRLDDLVGEIHFARMSIVQGKIDLIKARSARANRILEELRPTFEEQSRAVQQEQQKLHAIGEKMRPYQLHLRTSTADIGALNVQLGNLQYEWQERMNTAHAPAVKNLMRRPQA